MNLSNNSVIFINEIGESMYDYMYCNSYYSYYDHDHYYDDRKTKNGLQCVTDRKPCCRAPYKAGQWFFPNGTKVPGRDYSIGFHKNRGYDGTVNLNRPNTTIMSPTGLFCCTIPDAQGINQTLCANIGTQSDNLRAGV